MAVVFVYTVCVIRPTFECIHIVDIKQSRICLSVTNIIHTFTHRRIGHKWYSSNNHY